MLMVRNVVSSVKVPTVPSGDASTGSGDTALFTSLTAVVLNWDGPDLTIRCVQSLVGEGVPHSRIVVVDNGSTGDSYEQFQQKLSRCVLVRLPTNVGIGRALNIGATRLPGDEYLIMNNDAFVHAPTSVARLVRAVRRGRIGIAVPRLLNEDLTLQPSVVGLLSPRTALVGALGVSRLIPNRLQPHWSTHWDHSESRAIDAASGAVFAVRGETWRQLGGMTERRWMYGEDIDLCRRARAASWEIWFERESTFVHLGSSTVQHHWNEAARAAMIARSEVAMLRTHLPPFRARLTLLFLLLGTGLRWLAFSAAREEARAGVFRSVLRGYLGGIRSRDSRADERRSEG
jgi:N-acetylglucosaminyl-diphospho-decaprenol L-rhamnosyltransferase